jgi:hypothetical protein
LTNYNTYDDLIDQLCNDKFPKINNKTKISLQELFTDIENKTVVNSSKISTSTNQKINDKDGENDIDEENMNAENDVDNSLTINAAIGVSSGIGAVGSAGIEANGDYIRKKAKSIVSILFLF